MKIPLISEELLLKSDRIIFVTHLALGDFTYMQTYFRAFACKYPHLKIDIIVDEVRRSRLFWRWKNLKNYALYDWLTTCGLFCTIYNQTYSPGSLRKTIKIIQAQQYPIVVSLASIRHDYYASYARRLSPHGFVVGVVPACRRWDFLKQRRYLQLDARIAPKPQEPIGHITDVYAFWFFQLCGLVIEQNERAPVLDIPRKWVTYAKLRFLKWGIDKKNKGFGHVFFINPCAKTPKRSMSFESVIELILLLKHDDTWGDTTFIINVDPSQYLHARKFFDKYSQTNTILFTADCSFYQLPAIISICDLVISVETSVMHFASALQVPVVALMRTKNPEWVPWDRSKSIVVWAASRKAWVKDIQLSSVVDAIKELYPRSST